MKISPAVILPTKTIPDPAMGCGSRQFGMRMELVIGNDLPSQVRHYPVGTRTLLRSTISRILFWTATGSLPRLLPSGYSTSLRIGAAALHISDLREFAAVVAGKKTPEISLEHDLNVQEALLHACGMV